MPRSSTRPCRTGIRATRTARAASITSSPSAATAAGRNSKISWTQVETGSAITWKYPSCILRGDDARGEFYSIAVSNGYPAGRQRHQDDPPRHEHHSAASSPRASRRAIRKIPIADWSRPTARPRARATSPTAISLLIGDQLRRPYRALYRGEATPRAHFEHEATTSKISEDQLFYCRQRGFEQEEAVALIVNGFVRDVLQQLPMEFMAETRSWIGISLEELGPDEPGRARPVAAVAMAAGAVQGALALGTAFATRRVARGGSTGRQKRQVVRGGTGRWVGRADCSRRRQMRDAVEMMSAMVLARVKRADGRERMPSGAMPYRRQALASSCARATSAPWSRLSEPTKPFSSKLQQEQAWRRQLLRMDGGALSGGDRGVAKQFRQGVEVWGARRPRRQALVEKTKVMLKIENLRVKLSDEDKLILDGVSL